MQRIHPAITPTSITICPVFIGLAMRCRIIKPTIATRMVHDAGLSTGTITGIADQYVSIGIPSFVLALEPNKELIRGHFLTNVLVRALPAGLTDFIVVSGLVIFCREFQVDLDCLSTSCTILVFTGNFKFPGIFLSFCNRKKQFLVRNRKRRLIRFEFSCGYLPDSLLHIHTCFSTSMSFIIYDSLYACKNQPHFYALEKRAWIMRHLAEIHSTIRLRYRRTGSVIIAKITSENHIPVRGIVYSTHPRMECLTPQFEGENIRIRYQFHSKGLVEGQEEKGAFVILCNQSVHSLSFCVSISRLYAQTAADAIRSLSDFTALAKENWQEAYQLFYHKSFPNILKAKETKEKMYYQGILAAKPSSQNLEEFLVAAGRKEQIHFTISETDCRFDALTESQQQKIEIKKSEWGYLELAITSDAAFVQPAQTQITSEDFLGSTFVLKYIVDYDRMHAGNNYAKITFSSVYETKVLEIYAHKGEKQKSKEQKEHAKIRECQSGLVELYEAFRLKKIVTGVWANESVERLNQLHAMLPDQVMYPLMKAQALVINHQKQEAEWILEEFKREWPDHHTPEWGYYLYIMTLLEREPAYVDRMTHEIEMIFHENPDSALLFWVLSFLVEEYYNNSAHKLRAIAHWVMSGCVSPYLYLEAYDLISHDPYLLTKLGRFEVRILRWAIRHKVLTKEQAAQIFEVVEMNQGFHPVHFELMQAAYGTEEKPEYVGQICSYLIRTQQFDTKFHHWYEKGIGLELRITGLYEAYLMSLDEREIASVPKIIRMYFQYDSNLPARSVPWQNGSSPGDTVHKFPVRFPLTQ